MSIFPKRTIAGSAVTIHWNLSLPPGMQEAVCPYVRIGIQNPAGSTHWLMDEHLLLLPSTAAPASPALQQNTPYQYLNKHTPLLVVASYLAGAQPREKLVEMLTGIQHGRHYYFTWQVPSGAQPGKYRIISEMVLDGQLKHSGTAAEDFFYVEQLEITLQSAATILLHNPGPEPVPAKLITYPDQQYQQPASLEVFYLAPNESRTVSVLHQAVFLVYNEERITMALHHWQQPRVLRNQQFASLHKQEAGEAVTYVLPREGENAWRLTGHQQTLWNKANGLHTEAGLRCLHNDAFEEMIAHGLITIIP